MHFGRSEQMLFVLLSSLLYFLLHRHQYAICAAQVERVYQKDLQILEDGACSEKYVIYVERIDCQKIIVETDPTVRKLKNDSCYWNSFLPPIELSVTHLFGALGLAILYYYRKHYTTQRDNQKYAQSAINMLMERRRGKPY